MDMDTEKTEVKHGIQVSERSPRHKWDIVAAFDIGTSYSGYAYSDRKEMDLQSIFFNQWTGNMVSDPKAKAPTTLLYDKNMRFYSFGYEAEDFYATQVCEKKKDDWYRFKNFKMVLYREKNVPRDLKISDDSERVSLLASEVFSQTIKFLKSHFESTVRERALQFEPGNVLYVVTVPAIWTQSAKLFMKKAAMQAGIPEAQLLIALEPEAAAMYCKSLPEQTLTDTFKPHKRYMVLDLGGGTVDVVVHDVLEDGDLAEVYKASGGALGGTMVDLEFERYVQNIFNNETCLKELWNLSPRDAYDLEREFEMKKRQISNKASDIRLKLPARLQQVGKVPVTSSITFDHIYVQFPKFKEFFENPINRIISLIKDILNEVGRLDQIILVGGFSSSRYLYDQLKSHSDIFSTDIYRPKEPGLAVLQGAVLFGYNPEDVRYRICRYTFGFGVLQDFDESEHRADKLDVVDDEVVCKDVFDVLVYEGEKVKFDDPKFATSKSSHRQADRKHIPIKKELFAGKNIPRDRTVYVTEEGIKSLAKIITHAPEEGWSNLVEFKTKVYFGQTEIKIEDFDITNNVAVNVEIDFL